MDSVIDHTVGLVVDVLKQIGTHYYTLLSGTGDKVDELAKQVETLYGLINYFRGKYLARNENEALEQLLLEITGVALEAENAIRRHKAAVLRKKHSGIPYKAGNFLFDYVPTLENISGEIEKINENIQVFFENRANLILDIGRTDQIDSRERKDLTVTEHSTIMVGLKTEIGDIIQRLRTNTKREVISIVGMPGLGKTKMAMHVIQEKVINLTFSPSAFFRVTKEYKREELLLEILRVLKTKNEVDTTSEKQIRDAIFNELKGKRYMIVLDDVWSKDVWRELKDAFPDNVGSKVLLTTRDSDVALHASGNEDSVIPLRDLEQEECEELLRIEVFGESRCPPHLEKYVRKIVTECGKLPMSIKVIAGVLFGKKSSDWKIVAKSVHSYLGKNKDVSDLIRLSYDNLPKHLKKCFLYLGIFHGGSRIPAWKLYQLWIAEGFVLKEEDIRLEDTADCYLKELVARNLVRVEESRLNGEIKTCNLHDTVRDFCKREATSLNLFRVITTMYAEADSSSVQKHCPRLSINHSHFLPYISKMPSHENLETFLNLSKEAAAGSSSTDDLIRIPKKVASSFAKGFELLKVLDARSIIFPKFPDELLQLVLLRFLSISFDSNILPEKLSDLENLQTLLVRKSQDLQEPLEITADIWNMSELRHLHTNVCILLNCPLPKGPLGKYQISENIQTISRISSESCTPDVLKRIPCIKKLGICGKLDASLFESLSGLEFLEDLRLSNDEGFQSQSQMCARAFPTTSKKFPENLTKLTLKNTFLDWSYMPVLAGSENLEVLKLKENAFVQGNWGSVNEGFTSLQVLHIGKVNLMDWQTKVSSFLALKCLIFKGCKTLRRIPPEIGDKESLENVLLYGTNQYLVQDARKLEKMKLDSKKPFRLMVGDTDDSDSTSDDKQHPDEPKNEEKEQTKPSIFKKMFKWSSKSNEKSSKSKNKGL